MNLVSLEVKTSIKLDAKKIKDLLEWKVINKEAFIYFAFKLTQEESKLKSIEIDIEDFCEEWNLKKVEVRKALSSLESKGAISTNMPAIVQLSLF